MSYNFSLGTVTSISGGCFIKIDGDSEPLKSPCLLPKGATAAAGDRALLLTLPGGRCVVALF